MKGFLGLNTLDNWHISIKNIQFQKKLKPFGILSLALIKDFITFEGVQIRHARRAIEAHK